MPNCVYSLQEASSWNWLSCQTHRTPVILVTTWLLRQLYNYEGVSNAVNCIADFGCKRLFKLIKLPQTLCCFHPGWDGYDHIRQWWWKRLASPSGWSWAKHYHTIAIIFKHLLIVSCSGSQFCWGHCCCQFQSLSDVGCQFHELSLLSPPS